MGHRLLDQETVAKAPERILAGGTKEAKRQDECDGEYREEIEDEEQFLAGEIEDDVQGERDQESDSRFAEPIGDLACSRHLLRLSRVGVLGVGLSPVLPSRAAAEPAQRMGTTSVRRILRELPGSSVENQFSDMPTTRKPSVMSQVIIDI